MNAPVAATGDTLSLRFALRLADGREIISNLQDAQPDTMTLGDGTLAPNLERWLIGLPAGERHVFMLEAEQAFGLSQADKIHSLKHAQLDSDAALQVGSLVEFTNAQGQSLAGQILAIEASHISVDFNHPLADQAIEFEVEIISLHKNAMPRPNSDE